MNRAVKAAFGSLVIGAAVVGLKAGAWRLTGSVALFSDALESLINVAAAIAAIVALSVSARPADAGHPYGHQKAEYFSAVLEGVLIVLAALTIIYQAYASYQNDVAIETPGMGIGLNAAAALINGIWSLFLIRSGRRWRSPAIVADGRHLFADVITSVGVLIGVGLVAFTGWRLLDPLIAVAVALNILRIGYQLVRESLGELMDRAIDPNLQQDIRALLSEEAVGAIQAHDLRTRTAGHVTFIEFHLVVPGSMSVAEAHAICDRVESAIRKLTGEAVITIHVEPDDMAERHAVVVLS